MLNEKLEKRSKIGSPRSIMFVASWLGKGTTNVDTIKEMAKTTSGINSSEIEPVVWLFDSMGLVKLSGEYAECTQDLKIKYKQGEQAFRDWFLDRFIEFSLNEDIIEIDTITYSIEHDAFIMSATTIKQRHACYRNVLTDYRVVTLLPDARYLVNEPLDKAIKTPTRHRAISEKQLLRNLQNQKEQGERGELFVLEYEKKRITNKTLQNGIKRISIIDVSSGFDIVSYNSNESIQLDRFIEVKTFKGNEHFHWSQNEIARADLMGDSYFLYLVDDDCIDKEDYEPTIIQNPAHFVLQSEEWLKSPDSLFVEKVMNGGYHSTTTITTIQDKENETLRRVINAKDEEIARLRKEIDDIRQNDGYQMPRIENNYGDIVVGNKHVGSEVGNVESGATGISVNKEK